MSVPQGDDRILLSEWGSAYPGASLLGAGFDRPSCPICGHPTMDCTHNDVPGGLMSDKQPAAKAAPKSKDADTESVVVKNTDPIDETVFGDSETGETYVTITKDVIEEFVYPGTKRPAQRILFAKGQVVAKSTIDALNANVAAAKAAEGDDK